MMKPKRSGRVLLIEDDENDILLMQRAFSKARIEIEVEVIRDGDAAVEYFSHHIANSDSSYKNLPWLILLDLKLPRRSGLEVLAWIRQHSQFRVIPIVVLTASNESQDIQTAYDLHVNSYLIKPINFKDLVQMVELINSYWLEVNTPPISKI